jgi:fructose/tagatose bisphosphate aldolase
MPLVLDRQHVLDTYAEARDRKWVIPNFNAENLTTMEAILSAVLRHGERLGVDDLPISIGITNNYASRPQAVLYSSTRRWSVGLQLFLKNLKVLSSTDSPFAKLRVMVHLDHVQWDTDSGLLGWDMKQFSSIMYDASTLDLEANMSRTAAFVERHGKDVVIEGACDEISSASDSNRLDLTNPDDAEKYARQTGVDIIVANLGTEHRAASSSLHYEGKLAREISRRIGPRLCLHGASSLAESEIANLFADGVSKVNIWTALERDSTPVLLRAMVKNAAKLVGAEQAIGMRTDGLLGASVDAESGRSVEYFTAAYRRDIIVDQMASIVEKFLKVLLPRPEPVL